MDDEPESTPWAGLTLARLVSEQGLLKTDELFARAELPEATLPAEAVIERLAGVPGGSRFGQEEALRELLAETDAPEEALGEVIADAARKLAALTEVVGEIASEWEMDRWATLERILKRERELMELRERLARLPNPDSDAVALRRAAAVSQEELAGLIGILDRFRLTLREEKTLPPSDEDAPAFTRPESVLRLLHAQQERKKAA